MVGEKPAETLTIDDVSHTKWKIWDIFYLGTFPLGTYAVAEVVNNGDYLNIESLQVDESLRRQGYGKLILNKVIDYAKKLGIKEIRGTFSPLEKDEEAVRAFDKNMGFQSTTGEDGSEIMVLKLD